MATTTWSFPTRVIFGVGAAAETGREAFRLGGRRALVVTDAGVSRAGLLGPILDSLRTAGLAAATFDGVLGNPVERNVHDAARAFEESDSDLVVAVGGGSPLDVGKLVRLRARHKLPLAAYDDAIGGDVHITDDLPPMIAVPTTAGTGSEVGRSGVVTLEATGRKTVIFSPHLMPNAALLDPALTRSMPPGTTAATGFDALTHCVEAYLAQGDHPLCDAVAQGGIQLVRRALRRAVLDGEDLAARGDMMKAAMMGAVAFQKGLGACHSLAHPLSSEHGVHHGLANALCLPAVLSWNAAAAPERLAEISALLGGEPVAAGAAEAVRELRRAVGLPSGLEAVGVPRGALDALSDLAFEDACHRSNPRPCTRDDLFALYEASM